MPESAREILDGSYVTRKARPGDIDIAVEVPVESTEQVLTHRAVGLLQGPETSREYYCDAYPIFRLPEAHPHYESVTVAAIRYWTKWLGTDRQRRLKGRGWATVGGLRT